MTPPLRAALETFRGRVFQAMVNPDKAPTDEVALAFRAWEATLQRDATDCDLRIQRYLEHPHTDRLTYANAYATYQQELSQAYQAYESSTLANHLKTRRAYLHKAQKPDALLRPPPQIYTVGSAKP